MRVLPLDRMAVLVARRSSRRAAARRPPGSPVARLLAWRRRADRRMKLPSSPDVQLCRPHPCRAKRGVSRMAICIARWPRAPCRINRASRQCPKLAAHDEGAREEGSFPRSWMPPLAGVPLSAVFCWRGLLLAVAALSLSYAARCLSYARSSLSYRRRRSISSPWARMPPSNLSATWAI
ncbi:hypothetical protein Dimus_017901 [Dionaea muscipula]